MGGGRAGQRRRGRADVVARPRSHRRFSRNATFARTTRGRAIRKARGGNTPRGTTYLAEKTRTRRRGARARVGRGDHAFGRSDADRTEIVHDKDERFFPHRSGFERKPPRWGRRRDFFSLSTRGASQTRRNPRLLSPSSIQPVGGGIPGIFPPNANGGNPPLVAGATLARKPSKPPVPATPKSPFPLATPGAPPIQLGDSKLSDRRSMSISRRLSADPRRSVGGSQSSSSSTGGGGGGALG